ncbi:DUF4249 domain-containing protein [Hymenobacter rigui]|uniref:DUF4249 domain-containing protein n=1 Tax=Hymenobacter rigui TaxID=334424 RepID=A0A3R9MT74_9BACT|nr:DUF4249 domain-containing protein [Hymenobacter rigui]RSK49479.1 DUF4249 domain-containing protein [Hymenobacter rigui]
MLTGRSWRWMRSLLLLLLAGCVEPYAPEVIIAPNNYLVVNGYINGNGVTSIQLSRSQQLAATGVYPPETRATVYIETLANKRYPLAETTAGLYTSVSQKLPTDQQYRLRIRTVAGHDYTSDFTALKLTPAVDQLEGRVQPNGVQLYLSTHDDQNQTRYYRWEYEETWEFFAAHESLYEYVPSSGMTIPRKEGIYHCWRTEKSTTIETSSTARLSQDAVRDYRMQFIQPRSPKLRSKYSILVRQYGMSQAEFDYWEEVKKNTENIGTLFDPLPSQIQGNVHAVSDAEEPVFGFVGATTQVEKRIFIGRLDVPLEWSYINEGYEQCPEPFPAPSGYTAQQLFGELNLELVSRSTMLPRECVDCRLRGSNVKPSFWP